MRAILKYEDVFRKLPVLWRLGVGVALLCGAFAIDFYTGPEVVSSLFYLVPVIYFSLFFGTSYGIAASIMGAFCSLCSDMLSNKSYPSPLIPYWNMLVQCGIFLIASSVMVMLRDDLKREKNYSAALQKANEEIVRLAKIKTDFCAMVSHELRTPMATIRESIRMIDDGIAGHVSDEQKVYLGMTQRNVERLIRLINDILDFSKLEDGKWRLNIGEADLNGLIQESVNFLSPLAAHKGLEIRFVLDPANKKVPCDADAVLEILQNIAGNAIKFTPKGTVTLRSEFLDGQAKVSVTDTGCGIGKDDLSRLFRPFEQITAKDGTRPEGTGLGLSIAQRVIKLHGGEIWAESEVDRGTTISFTLPLNHS